MLLLLLLLLMGAIISKMVTFAVVMVVAIGMDESKFVIPVVGV